MRRPPSRNYPRPVMWLWRHEPVPFYVVFLLVVAGIFVLILRSAS